MAICRLSTLTTFLCVALSACTTFPEALQKADASCTDRSSATAQASCWHYVEYPVWARYEPNTIGAFVAYSSTRLQLAQQYDAHRITLDRYKSEIAQARQLLENQENLALLQQREQNQAQAQMFFSALLAGFAAYEQGKASAPQPQTEHTNCIWLAGQLHCTTTSY